MEKTFQIGEIARFFDLAPSTLRYWEECGILGEGGPCVGHDHAGLPAELNRAFS